MIVVDTSVAFKWFVPEPHSNAAVDLIGTEMVAPALMLIECGNAFWKKIRKGEETRENAAVALASLNRFVTFEPDEPLALAAFALATELRHPIYDCMFLALAERRNLLLATADVKLIERCAGTRFETRFLDWHTHAS